MMGSLPSSSNVSPQWPSSGASLKVLSLHMSSYSSDYAQVPSAARLTICIYRERLEQCMPYYDVLNLVTVTKMNMIWRNDLWLGKNDCSENMASILPQSCAAASTSLEVSRRTAQLSQLHLKSPANLCRGLTSFKICLFYKFNLVASWMHLHNCRCFQGQQGILLQSLRALCLAPGGSGSIWKYLEALVRSPGVSRRIECGFQTELHYTDVIQKVACSRETMWHTLLKQRRAKVMIRGLSGLRDRCGNTVSWRYRHSNSAGTERYEKCWKGGIDNHKAWNNIWGDVDCHSR